MTSIRIKDCDGVWDESPSELVAFRFLDLALPCFGCRGIRFRTNGGELGSFGFGPSFGEEGQGHSVSLRAPRAVLRLYIIGELQENDASDSIMTKKKSSWKVRITSIPC